MGKAATKAATAATEETLSNSLPTATEQNLPSTKRSLFDDEETGFENVTSRDLIIPRLAILQGLSPQVTQGKPEYDKDAKVGDIYDVALQERYQEIVFVPIYYSTAYLEWAPRESGKGLVAIHYDESVMPERDENGKNIIKSGPNAGNYIVETKQLYGINVTGQYRKCLIPMSSMQIKKAKHIMTWSQNEMATREDGTMYKTPIWYRSYILTTVPESNKKGNWMGWKVKRGLLLEELVPNWDKVGPSFIADIKNFRRAIASGEARGDLSGVEDESVSHSDVM